MIPSSSDQIRGRCDGRKIITVAGRLRSVQAYSESVRVVQRRVLERLVDWVLREVEVSKVGSLWDLGVVECVLRAGLLHHWRRSRRSSFPVRGIALHCRSPVVGVWVNLRVRESRFCARVW